MDIICTEPGDNYFDALGAASTFGRSEAPWLLREAENGRALGPTGYALFSFGAVSWKDEPTSAAIIVVECSDAPALGKHNKALEDAVRSILETCPRPQFAPYHFVCRDSRWQILRV